MPPLVHTCDPHINLCPFALSASKMSSDSRSGRSSTESEQTDGATALQSLMTKVAMRRASKARVPTAAAAALDAAVLGQSRKLYFPKRLLAGACSVPRGTQRADTPT